MISSAAILPSRLPSPRLPAPVAEDAADALFAAARDLAALLETRGHIASPEAHGSPRVYRLRTDAGEALLGRLVPAEGLDRLYAAFGLDIDGDRSVPALSPGGAYDALCAGATLHLAGAQTVKRVTLAGGHRLEFIGFPEGALAGLKALGLTAEIVAWRLRVFVPLDPERGPAILAALLERHSLLRVTGGRTGQAA